MKASPTQRSMEVLRERGYQVDVVERTFRLPGGRMFKRDLFGGFDLAAVGNGELVLVQTTSADNVAARITKITDLPALPLLREAGIRLLVHGWMKPTKTIRTWRLREEDIS